MTAQAEAAPPFIAALVTEGRLTAGSNRPVPWWSFGKTVLAAAALVLVARGTLHLDAPLPGRPFTLRQLLAHRAGLADYGSLASYHAAVSVGEAPWPAAVVVARAGAPRCAPGQEWHYSNIGYLLLRQILEDRCQASLDVLLEQLVLRPLGIRGVSVATSPETLAATAWGNAGGYHPGWVYHGLLVGPAGAAALLLDRLLAGHLLPPSLLAAMRDAVPVCGPLPRRPWQAVGYGLGLAVSLAGGLAACEAAPGLFLGHTGEGPGSTAAVYRHEPSGPAGPSRTVAVFAPVDGPGPVEARAVALLAAGSVRGS